MKLIKMGALNFTSENGELGVRFVPDIVLERLKKSFPELTVDDIDKITIRIQFLESEIKNIKDEIKISAYKDMINQEKNKTPAHSFKLKDNKNIIRGLIIPQQISFFLNSSDDIQFSENMEKRITNFLNKYSFDIYSS